MTKSTRKLAHASGIASEPSGDATPDLRRYIILGTTGAVYGFPESSFPGRADLYVSSTMIDALAPASLQPGPVEVVVTVNGAGSAPFTTTASSTIPAVYALPDAAGPACSSLPRSPEPPRWWATRRVIRESPARPAPAILSTST